MTASKITDRVEIPIRLVCRILDKTLEGQAEALASMPIVKVLMFPGRTQQQKDDLANAITDAVEKIAKAPRDQTIVVIQEVPKEQYYVAARRAA